VEVLHQAIVVPAPKELQKVLLQEEEPLQKVQELAVAVLLQAEVELHLQRVAVAKQHQKAQELHLKEVLKVQEVLPKAALDQEEELVQDQLQADAVQMKVAIKLLQQEEVAQAVREEVMMQSLHA
jgi:hypothetical protein